MVSFVPASCQEVLLRFEDAVALSSHPQGWFFERGCRDRRFGPQRIHSSSTRRTGLNFPTGVMNGISLCKATIPQIAEFSLYLRSELKPSIPAVKGYRVAFNYVFSLAGKDLAANLIIDRMFSSFKRTPSKRG